MGGATGAGAPPKEGLLSGVGDFLFCLMSRACLRGLLDLLLGLRLRDLRRLRSPLRLRRLSLLPLRLDVCVCVCVRVQWVFKGKHVDSYWLYCKQPLSKMGQKTPHN